MSLKNFHVVPHGTQWAVKQEGLEQPVAVRPTKEEAEQMAKEFAKQFKGEFVEHGKDGKIDDKDSYGNDPFPPKDRKH